MPFIASARGSFGPQGRFGGKGLLKSGLSSAQAGDNAFQIKTDYPSSTDGLYWIKNNNINGGTPFQVYCDMTKNGGGWTLILTGRGDSISYMGWDYTNIRFRNTNSPSMVDPYSIIGWSPYIQKASSGWQWMVEAADDSTTRYTNGGIFTANSNYTLDGTTPNATNITANEFFTVTGFNENNGIGARVPWRKQNATQGDNNNGPIYTTYPENGSWWGTIIQSNINYDSYKVGPWISSGQTDPLWSRVWVR
jgi:hypothetical protein